MRICNGFATLSRQPWILSAVGECEATGYWLRLSITARVTIQVAQSRSVM
jgi:hypothetical protein